MIPVDDAFGAPSLGGSVSLTPGATPWSFDVQVRANLSLAQGTQPQTNSVRLVFGTGPAGDIFSGDPITSLILSPYTQLRLTGRIDMRADLAGPVSEGGVTDNASYQTG